MKFSENPLYKDDIYYISNLDLPWAILENSTILISGATGLLGSVLVDSLMTRVRDYGNNIKIIALGRNENRAKERFLAYWNESFFEFVQHDVNNPIPELGEANYVIHAASNTHPVAYATDPINTITTNVFGTYNLLEYAVGHNLNRFVFVSSVEIYGESSDAIDRFTENDMGYIDSNFLRSGYPESKRVGEAMCNAYASLHNVDFVIPRLCRIYGPSMIDGDSKAIFQFVQNAVDNQDIILKSKGDQMYSFCYSADAISAMLYILFYGQAGEAYNVSDTRSDISLKDLAELIASISGNKVVFDLPDEIESTGFSKATRALLDHSKLSSLGWSARDVISSGLSKTISIIKGV